MPVIISNREHVFLKERKKMALFIRHFLHSRPVPTTRGTPDGWSIRDAFRMDIYRSHIRCGFCSCAL